jgi:hypothetical protein
MVLFDPGGSFVVTVPTTSTLGGRSPRYSVNVNCSV